jgi:Uncharacterized conserved domain (SAYSvFN)
MAIVLTIDHSLMPLHTHHHHHHLINQTSSLVSPLLIFSILGILLSNDDPSRSEVRIPLDLPAETLILIMVRSANERSTSFYVSLAFFFVLGTILVSYGFGVVTFVLWVFVAIWTFGFRDKFSTETTASAYSVFNKDGKSIVGGFTGSQFERQLRGPLAAVEVDDSLKGSVPELSQQSSSSCCSNIDKPSQSVILSIEREKRRKAAAEAAERRFKGA